MARGFAPVAPQLQHRAHGNSCCDSDQFFFRPTTAPTSNQNPHRKQETSLNLLMEVPDYFFTLTFPILGIVLSVSRNFQRLRMEERAWEQRVEEAREKRLRDDPTLTELDLRRQEASVEWSAYGKPRMDEERARNEEYEEMSRRGSRRVRVMDKVDDRNENARESNVDHRMTDEEIALFELEYGVEYDPYYDDPYSEDELPDDVAFDVDKRYGDRIYQNGEIFYKDKETGLFYRQGARPRNLSFFG